MKAFRRIGIAGALVFSSLLAWGATSTWTGAIDTDFNNAGNWTNGVPTDIGNFGNAAQTNLTMSQDTSVNSMQFNTGAPVYTFYNPTNVMSINGNGFTGSSTTTVRFVNSGTLLINGAATSGAVTIGLDNRFGQGTLIYNNTATAGNTTITSVDNTDRSPAGSVQFNNSANAAHATFQRGAGYLGTLIIQFNDTTSAGSATITADSTFSGLSTAGNANIVGGNTSTGFYGSSNAGNSHITGQGSYDSAYFAENSSAANAAISIVGADYVQFQDNAGGGNASIFNSSGRIAFENNSTAQNASITNSGTGSDSVDPCTATSLDMTSNLNFCGNSTAGNSSIVNNNSTLVHFGDLSSASTALISNTGASSTTFHDASNASVATIVNSGTQSATIFYDVANAGSAQLQNRGTGNIIQFNNSSSAGSALIDNNGGGLVQFNDTSSGGNAAVDNASGTISISNLSSMSLTLGSLGGGGTVDLGSKNLTVGGNGLDTIVSGVISGPGGSLVKVGSGTLVLSGINTYSGGTTIVSGALGITAESSLGAVGGILNLSGGTLQTEGNITSARAINLVGGGDIDTNGFNSNLTGNVTGAGSLLKSGSGTLTLAGSNTYAGSTLIYGGILQLGSSNALPAGTDVVLANSAGAALDLNGYGTTLGSLSGGGSAGGNVLLGTATLTVGANDLSSAYLGMISGTGSFVKVGSGTLVLSDANDYTGTTTVSDGNLIFVQTSTGALPASLPSMGNIQNFSTLTVGSNGAGSLHVSSYAGTGTLGLSFNGSSFTSLLVDNTATLTGGKLSIAGTNFKSGRYRVITAGSVAGTFDQILAPSPSVFLKVGADYTPTEVQVNILALNFADVAATGNQRNLSTVLDVGRPTAAGNFGTAVQALYALPTAGQAQAAFNQISGDSLASFQNTGFQSADMFTSQMTGRSIPADGMTVAQLSEPVQLAYAGDQTSRLLDGLLVSSAPVAIYGLWSRGLGFFDHVDADSSIGSPASRATSGGFQAGYDFLLADDVVFGLSGGYAKTSLSVDDRASSGNSTSIQSGIYASYTPGLWFVNGAMAYTTSSNDMTRPIQFTGINETAAASFQSRVYTTFIEGGYRYHPHENTNLEPTISLKDSYLRQDAFTESGAPGLNLDVQEQTVNSLVSAIGGRITHRFKDKTEHPFLLGGRIAWEHELADIQNNLTAQFAGTPGAAFSVQGTPRSRNAAALGIDGNIDLSKNLQGFADYSATLASSQNTQAVFGGLRVTW